MTAITAALPIGLRAVLACELPQLAPAWLAPLALRRRQS
jgi:hypothetical protein